MTANGCVIYDNLWNRGYFYAKGQFQNVKGLKLIADP